MADEIKGDVVPAATAAAEAEKSTGNEVRDRLTKAFADTPSEEAELNAKAQSEAEDAKEDAADEETKADEGEEADDRQDAKDTKEEAAEETENEFKGLTPEKAQEALNKKIGKEVAKRKALEEQLTAEQTARTAAEAKATTVEQQLAGEATQILSKFALPTEYLPAKDATELNELQGWQRTLEVAQDAIEENRGSEEVDGRSFKDWRNAAREKMRDGAARLATLQAQCAAARAQFLADARAGAKARTAPQAETVKKPVTVPPVKVGQAGKPPPAPPAATESKRGLGVLPEKTKHAFDKKQVAEGGVTPDKLRNALQQALGG